MYLRVERYYLGQRGRLWKPEGEEGDNYILGHVFLLPCSRTPFQQIDNQTCAFDKTHLSITEKRNGGTGQVWSQHLRNHLSSWPCCEPAEWPLGKFAFLIIDVLICKLVSITLLCRITKRVSDKVASTASGTKEVLHRRWLLPHRYLYNWWWQLLAWTLRRWGWL